MLNNSKLLYFIFALIFISGCASTATYTYSVGGRNVVCDGRAADLGNVVVLLQTAWRSDQKEPVKRKQMVLEEIKSVFRNIPCGNISLENSIRDYSFYHVSEYEMLKMLSAEGIDTVIIIRIEELTPRLNITYSIPFLWGGSNEAHFNIRGVLVKSGKAFMDMRVKRITGGPFNIRPADWSREELKAALNSVIRKE